MDADALTDLGYRVEAFGARAVSLLEQVGDRLANAAAIEARVIEAHAAVSPRQTDATTERPHSDRTSVVTTGPRNPWPRFVLVIASLLVTTVVLRRRC